MANITEIEEYLKKMLSYETFMSLEEERRKQAFDIMLELNSAKDLLIKTLKARVANLEVQNDILKGGKMANLTELDKLEEYLKKNDIPYERKERTNPNGGFLDDWHQIVVYGPKDYEWDAICHHGSYGYEEGLLEIMGDIVNKKEVGDSVEGWLTAEDVINRIEEMVMGDSNENDTM